MTPQEIQKLIKRVEELEKWKKERTSQQIVYPLDVQSIKTLMNYFMSVSDTYQYVYVGTLNDPTVTLFVGQQGSYQYQIQPTGVFPYTVDVTSNIFTTSSGRRFVNDEIISVFYAPGGAVPSPLVAGDLYYVISSTGTSFQLSLTSGGAAINITDDGTGRQFIVLPN